MKKLCKKFDFLFTKEKIKIYIYTGSQLISFLMAFLNKQIFQSENNNKRKYHLNFAEFVKPAC